MSIPDLQLSSNLKKLHLGIVKVLAANGPKADLTKITPQFSRAVLISENLLDNAKLVHLSIQVASRLNGAKTLMNHLGVSDITKAPAISISGSLRVTPGYYHTNPGWAHNSVLPEKSSVIIASSLDLTNTTLTIDPSVATLTIIVQKLTCGTAAQITYDDSSVWRPVSLPATNAHNGASYNPHGYGGGPKNGPNGGAGVAGQPGSHVTIVPPAAPNIEIYALDIDNMPAINIVGLKGAPGNPGQNGGNGGNGGGGKNGTDATFWCINEPGSGGAGGNGGPGGDGSAGGDGGSGGNLSILTLDSVWRRLYNTWNIYTDGGPGGDPGIGGTGGTGGQGGVPGTPGGWGHCRHLPVAPNGRRGANGNQGADGSPGDGGTITPSIITAAEWEEEMSLPLLQTINPSQGFAGAQVTGIGLNFGPGDSVLVNGHAVAASFPANGQFKVSLPTTLAGGPNSIAVRRAVDGKVSDAMNFTVQPFLTSTSASGGFTPGDTITITGTGFLNNAAVHLTQPSQAPQVLVPITASATSIRFQVPEVTGATEQSQGNASLSVVNPDGLASNVVQITRLSFVANGFLPSVNGFAFTNTSACPGSPTVGTFASDFGAGEIAVSTAFHPILTWAYYFLYHALLGPECHGLCTGFACGAMDRFTSGLRDTSAAFPAATPALKTEFTVDWGRQMSGELLAHFFKQCLNGPAQVMSTIQQVESAFADGPTRHNMPLIYFIPSGMPASSQWGKDLLAGHTIIPYKLVRPLGWTSGYNNVKIYIYDCNNPGSDNCFITFTQTGDTVTFNYANTDGVSYNPGYSTANGFTLGVATMDEALYKSVNLPWWSAAPWIVDFVLSPANLTVNNLAGQATGEAGGNIVAQVPGVVPSLISGSHNMVLVPRQLALQRTIQGTGSGTYTYANIAPPDPSMPSSAYASLFPQGANAVVPRERGFSLENVPCTAATKDVVLLGPDNHSIQIATSDASKAFNVLIAQRYDVQIGAAPNERNSQQMQYVKIEGVNLGAGEQLLLWTDAALSQVGVSNPGAAKNLQVTVSTIDPVNGNVLASQKVTAAVAAKGDCVVAIANWQQLAIPTLKQGALGALLPANFQKPVVK